jgi:phosphoribosylanthranilate isomerase
MVTTDIKICGITTADALEATIAANARYAGFVFYPPSPRNLTPSQSATLAAQAGSRIGKVGLFANADDLEISQAIAAAHLDAIQLHGNETPERSAQIKARFGKPVWKALPVACAADVDRALAYHDAVDLILFDAKTPKGALPGGMGLVFDWSFLGGYKAAQKWGLAGGLNPENVAEAIQITKAPLVDTSSGVESEPGVKDIEKIAAFCRAAHAA